ncbi:hypothetical protein EK904_001098, partial [Melospiza melodia maxima]
MPGLSTEKTPGYVSFPFGQLPLKRIIPPLWIFQLLGGLNGTGFSSRKNSMPLAGNTAVPV